MDDASKQAIEEINECRYLDLDGIEKTPQWGLIIRISEMAAGPSWPEDVVRDYTPELRRLMLDAMPVYAQSSCKKFEVVFDEVISYTVSNESYCKYPEAPEDFSGKLFRTFSWSYLLEQSRKTSYASEEYPGPDAQQHFEIACQNDLIDVIACCEPSVRVLV